MTFGVFIGVSLLLQGMDSFIITEVPFSPHNNTAAFEGGLSSTVYQSSAAVFGVLIGTVCSDNERIIWWLHLVGAVSFSALTVLCWATKTYTLETNAAVGVMLTTTAVLGASLFSAIPFFLVIAVRVAEPVSENLVSGLVLGVGMVVAAGLVELSSVISPLASLGVAGGLLFMELIVYYSVVNPPTNRN